MNRKFLKLLTIKSITLELIFFLLIGLAAAQQGKVNINEARFEELTAISGIDETIAAKIIKYRRENNNFKTIYDLMKINEINGELFEKIKDKLTTGDKKPAAQPEPPAVNNGSGQSVPDSAGGKAPDRIAEPPAADNPPAAENGTVPQATAPAATLPASKNEQAPSNAFEDGRSSSYSSASAPSTPGASSASNSAAPGDNFPRRRVSRIDDEVKRIEMTPDNYYKVIMGLMRLGKYEKAEKSLQDFLTKFPNDRRADDANYLLGACFEEKEDYKMAIDFYQKVYENTKSQIRGIAIFRIGICNDILGKAGDAIESYRRYVSEFPQSSSVKDAEARIETLLKKN